MGQSESQKKIEEDFEIFKLEDNGNALLRSKANDKDYLMRIVSCPNQSDLERLKTLLESRAQIKNHHLLSLVEIKEKQQDFICSIQYKMYLVLQYSFKNTAEEIRDRTKNHQFSPFQQSDLWSILYSCCTALHALYTNGVSHECLAAEHIFINKDGFVKVAEPLLFGLQKNHLEAMRTKESGFVNVHLSPQIMNCLEDQNFFYYQKQKSDIFILAMIVVDLALLRNNFLYDVPKRKAHLDLIPGLLKKVGERYTSNLVSILTEMLQVDSKTRPPLSYLIDRVEKCNNIGEDFTLETESNLKSNDASSQKDQDRFVFEKPAKYKELHIKDQCLLEQSAKTKMIQERVMVRIPPEQQSLSINQQSMGLNQHNFDGRVFSTTPHQSYYTTQGVHSGHHRDISTPTPLSNYPSAPSQPSQTVHFQSFRKSFDLYQRSRSIDSVKVAPSNPSNQYSRVEQNRPHLFVAKPRPFNTIENNPTIIQAKPAPQPVSAPQPVLVPPPVQVPPFSQTKVSAPQPEAKTSTPEPVRPQSIRAAEIERPEVNVKKTSQPLFSHEIPEVYNIMIKNRGGSVPKPQIFSNEQKNLIMDKAHVQTPQFQGQITKVNRFTSFKNYPHQTISRVSQDQDFSALNQIQLRKNISYAQSQTVHVDLNKNYSELDSFAKHAQSPVVMNKNHSFAPQPSSNPFSGSTPIPNPHSSPFSGSAAGGASHSPPPKALGVHAGSSVSYSFTPAKPQFGRQSESKSFKSGRDLSPVPKAQIDPDLQFIKEEIPDRGRYEGYKLFDQRNGHGVLYFKDGGHYDGQWKNDKMHGFGKLYYENGSIAYQGHWQNDEFSGQGRVYNMEPVTFPEEFNYRDFSQLGNKWTYYDGQFKNDSKHGKGYIKLTNGEMFEGVFDHDMIEGNGIFYKGSGEIVIGYWIDNKLFLNQSYQNQKK